MLGFRTLYQTPSLNVRIFQRLKLKNEVIKIKKVLNLGTSVIKKYK